MKKNKKIITHRFSYLYNILAIILSILTFAQFINLFTAKADVGILVGDILINALVIALLLSKHILGLIAITLILMVGLFSSSKGNDGLAIMINVLMLVLTIPILIDRFSSR